MARQRRWRRSIRFSSAFSFKEPFPDFLEYLVPGVTTIGWVVPKKYVEKVGDAGLQKASHRGRSVQVRRIRSRVEAGGEAFEEYWRKVPHVKRMEFHTIPEPATRLAMVRRGEVDIATFMQGVFYEDAKKDPKLRLLTPLSPGRWFVYLTSQWDPKSPWSDPRVRKAASLAIDRQTLADVHMPGCDPIGGLALAGRSFGGAISSGPLRSGSGQETAGRSRLSERLPRGQILSLRGRLLALWGAGGQLLEGRRHHVDIVLLDRPAWIAIREGGKMKGGLSSTWRAPTIGGRLSYLFGPDLLRQLSGYSGAVGSVQGERRSKGEERSDRRCPEVDLR